MKTWLTLPANGIRSVKKHQIASHSVTPATVKEDQPLEGSSQSGTLARALAAAGNGTVVFYVHLGINGGTVPFFGKFFSIHL